MDNTEENAREFSEKQQKVARRVAEIIKNELKESGIELNDEQFKKIEGIIVVSMIATMISLVFSK